MRVAIYPADTGGCGHYRCIWPAEALAAQGADLTLHRPDDDGDPDLHALFQQDVDPLDGREVGPARVIDVYPPDCDALVLQRPLRRDLVDAIPLLQAKGVQVVVEVDDDFASIHRRNVSWANVNPSIHPDRNHQHLMRACSLADHVVVTTPALARRYGRHGRVSVVPNCVPARYLDVKPEPHEGVVVGWTGSLDTHPTDLQVTRGAIRRVLDDTTAIFAVVGTGRGVAAALELSTAPLAAGWVPIEDYPSCMAQLDVGLVPLDDIIFNEAKSWLKLLEFSALGVATVVSPTEDNVRGAALGMGVLAGKPKDWYRHVRRLVDDDGLRAEVAGRSKDAARAWTIEGRCELWWDAWCAPVRGRMVA